MIKVSVCCVTYNHELYLGAAIESVLAQRFDGTIEMIIGEDCSSDGTRALALSYQERFPSQIKVLTPSVNMGMMPNLMATLSKCDGDYICLLDGDDYWTDNTKIQQQIAFLEANKQYAICTHNLVNIQSQPSTIVDFVRVEHDERDYTIADLAKENFIATASCMYRNNFTAGPSPTGYPAWLLDVKIGDYCLNLLAARHGKIKYFPAVMGAYRIHGGGVWTEKNHVDRAAMFFNTLHHLRQEFTSEIGVLLIAQQTAYFDFLADANSGALEEFVRKYPTEIDSFLTDNKRVILLKYFENMNAARSAEYRWGTKLLGPVRELLKKKA